MNIHIVTIAYGLAADTLALFNTATSEKHQVFWHLFLHSKYPDVVALCEELARRPNVTLYNYGFNRGVAKSWNEGVLNAYAAGADVVIVSNDDIVPAPGDLDRLAEAALAHPEAYMVTCHGFDRGMNKEFSMRYGFWAWQRRAIEVIGMLDENFIPMYYEDVDYERRRVLAGLQPFHVTDTYVIHQGSKSVYTVPGLLNQHHITLQANYEYYLSKWGEREKEHLLTPFGDPSLGLRIAPEDRHAPYPGRNRVDLDIVKM